MPDDFEVGEVMNAKKFIAATSREALLMVRNELGADAVILSNRKVDEGVEITALASADLAKMTEPKKMVIEPVPTQRSSAAAAQNKYVAADDAELSYDDFSSEVFYETTTAATISHPAKLQKPQQAVSYNPATKRLAEKLIAEQPKINNQTVRYVEPEVAPVAAAVPAAIIAEQQGILSEIKSMRNMMQEQIACLSWSDMQHRDPQRAQMLRSMLNAGFSPALSRQLLEKMPAEADISWVHQVLGNNLRVATQEEDVVVRGGVYALIGPTGVGKTTTTAKLAARAVVRYGADKVALLTTDSYRVGAHEQLRVYGKILGVEVHAVRDTEDLRLTLSALKRKHLVLIDTMGLGQRDSRVAEQTEMFNAAGVQRLLLLNATSSGDTLEDVVHKYNGAGVIGCIPTKLDEAGTLGTVLDVAVRHKLALHYITSGQRVPEDLHEVNLEYLLHRTFKAAAKAAPFTLRELDFPALMAGLGAASPAREAAHAV